MKFRGIAGLILVAGLARSTEFPRVSSENGRHTLLVDGKPFLMLGVQIHNSSGWPQILANNWAMMKDLHCNTVGVPVYWEAIEPQPGRFEFADLDAIIEGARKNGLRLALLWFGTWKNGTMDYAPAWVKQDPARFPRMLNAAGRPIRVLSPHSAANLDADRRAFAALMGHLRDVDGDPHTVILVQVENEAGSLGSDRDYGEAANTAFAGPVPAAVLAALNRKPGSWKEVFGVDAPEVFAAFYVARYVEQVAEAGKKVFALPLYVNVWPREQLGFIRPGESHPSGGAVSNLLAMWKALAPHIDILAPDIYDANAVPYRTLCQRYKRADNPLLIPETGTAISHMRHMFYAVGEFDALGVSAFGVDNLNSSGTLPERFRHLAANFRLLQPAIPALLEIRRAGNLRAAVEEEGMPDSMVHFDSFDAVARFGPVQDSYSGPHGTGTADVSGRVLIGQMAPGEFLILGNNANVVFRPALGDQQPTAQIVSAEEGGYQGAVWKRIRLLNGDETYFGIRLGPEGSTIRVKLTRY